MKTKTLLKIKKSNMNNQVLLALVEFTLNNYEKLKEGYNELTKEQKQSTPITIYIIKTFDLLLKQAKDELEKTDTQAQVEAK
jgi:Fic family protein